MWKSTRSLSENEKAKDLSTHSIASISYQSNCGDYFRGVPSNFSRIKGHMLHNIFNSSCPNALYLYSLDSVLHTSEAKRPGTDAKTYDKVLRLCNHLVKCVDYSIVYASPFLFCTADLDVCESILVSAAILYIHSDSKNIFHSLQLSWLTFDCRCNLDNNCNLL